MDNLSTTFQVDSGVEVGSIEHLDDETLIARTRRGDDDAFAELYRRHSYGALRLARHLGQREESDDVVAESFARLLDLLRRGKGPDQSFRAYLYTTVRHEAGHRAKAVQRVRPTDDEALIDSAVEFGGGTLDVFERTTIRAAYESLPERWRSVIWHLDVEGRKPQEIAEMLDLTPNSVSALVYRARSGLRDAYVQQHVNSRAPGEDVHRDTREQFGAVLRRTAAPRVLERVHAHLASCEACMAVYLELEVDAANVA
jgi:RNA polymerase sigma factor (sigma-70 family)